MKDVSWYNLIHRSASSRPPRARESPEEKEFWRRTGEAARNKKRPVSTKVKRTVKKIGKAVAPAVKRGKAVGRSLVKHGKAAGRELVKHGKVAGRELEKGGRAVARGTQKAARSYQAGYEKHRIRERGEGLMAGVNKVNNMDLEDFMNGKL